MPCESCSPIRAPAGMGEAKLKREKKKTDIVTRMFCSSLRTLSKTKVGREQIDKMGQDVKDWWEKHQEADKKREAKEKRARDAKAKKAANKKSGLAKLTKEEKKALGIK